jgi:hypothetical protein
MWTFRHLANPESQRSSLDMHSRFVLVLLLIAALFGMAMHAAADVAHAADAAHSDCGSSQNDAAPDDGESSAGDTAPHCCNTACHAWVPAASAAAPVLLKSVRDRALPPTAVLASNVSHGLRRPPRLSFVPLH